MKAIRETIYIKNQLGAATLVVALVLLLAITLMTFSGVKVGINEQRMATNEVGYREALEVAQGALDFGLAYLEDNKNAMNGWGWSACNSSTAVPCGNGFANLYSSGGPLPGNWLGFVPSVSLPGLSNNYSYTMGFVTPSSGGLPAANPVVTIVARATNNSDPSVGTTLRQTVKGYPITINPPSRPLIGLKVKLNNNAQVWGNPTSSPSSSIQSILYRDELNFDGDNSMTCSGVYSTCGSLLSKRNAFAADVSSGGFPADLFHSTFGIASSSYQDLKNEITIFDNCTPFTTTPYPPSGIYWINNNCEIDVNNLDVGSAAAPIVLVVDGKFSFDADEFYGLVFLRADDNTDPDKADVKHDSIIHGAIISESTDWIQLKNSTKIEYNATVLNNARNLAGSFAKAPGGWTDQ